MTINEMLKKVETFNEMAEMLNVTRFNEKVHLYMEDKSFVCSEIHEAENAKSFRKLIKDTYVEDFAKKILSYKDYKFNAPVTFNRVDCFGSESSLTVEFFAE